MIPAKKFGGKVTQYFIGFGPTVWSRQVGETEYGLKAIPLGGYVKIVGMLPPGAEDLGDGRPRRGRRAGPQVRKSNTGMFTQLISDARAAEWELIRARRRGPAVLQDGLVEEGHRDGRRADGQHPDRLLHLPGASSRRTATRATSRHARRRPGRRLRRASVEDDRDAPARRGPGRPGARRAWSPATGRRLQRHRGHRLEASLQTLIRANDDGGPRRRSSATGRAVAHHQHHGDARPVDDHGRDRSPRSASSASARASAGDRRADLHPRADGHDDRTPWSRRSAPCRSRSGAWPRRSSAWRSADSPVSIVGGGRLAGETAAHEAFPSPRRSSSC